MASSASSGGGGPGATMPGLRFSANFESGNIGKVTVINDHEFDIEIAPDTNNARLASTIHVFITRMCFFVV